MADVAKLAGVSHQTVSRVINDSAHVRPETRRRVLAAMRQLDYRPNPAARALVTGRSRTLGVVSFDTTLYGPASTLFAIEQAAHAAGYFITIVSLHALDRRVGHGRGRAAARAGRRRHPRDLAAGGRGRGARQPAGRHPARGRRGRPGRVGAGGRRRPVRRRGERDAPAARPRPPHRPPRRRPARLARGPRARRGLARGARRGGRRGAAGPRRRLERALGLRARPAARRGAGRHGRVRRERPDGARRCCARCTSAAAGSPRRSASSASTTSPRRSTSCRR